LKIKGIFGESGENGPQTFRAVLKIVQLFGWGKMGDPHLAFLHA
jgi:hypothetical protein